MAQGHIPSNDFSMYDHVLDTSLLLGAIPPRYRQLQNLTETYFAMGRGLQVASQGIDLPSCEMKKWFDTNYHYIVPEFDANSSFALSAVNKPLVEFKEALALGITTRPVILSPISFLLLGKAVDGVDVLSLLPKLLGVYGQLLKSLEENGAEWIQLDEPILCKDALPASFKAVFRTAYDSLRAAAPKLKLLVTSYFDSLSDNLALVTDLPIAGVHFDLIRAPQDFELLSGLPAHLTLSLGVINGRNIWKTDLTATLAKLQTFLSSQPASREVIIAPSCSLLHSPHSLHAEVKMNAEIKDWLAFAVEKLHELHLLSKALSSPADSAKSLLQANHASAVSRRNSALIHNSAVKAAVDAIKPDMFRRQSPFTVRQKAQQQRLNLPLFPTTTVGSFPQTKEVRLARDKFKKGEWSVEQYQTFVREETEKCVAFQEEVGLDMLVDGEFERNDMVEFFGECLKGYVFSQNGWVQSYGSRCVKPPILFGDISRPNAMTVKMSSFAQSLTSRPMKGMLTGPVTMLQWSFVRDDQPRQQTAYQMALALRQEVVDLEAAGLLAIQIDEPAIREGLPLKAKDHDSYLKWAVDSFKLSSSGVHDATQIHTHMCYSDFNDIFPAIQALDADCITIEASKSDLKLLSAFEKYGYSAGIGPGLYDIHSPRVPSVAEMKERFAAMTKLIEPSLLWVNPDCGLKTRGWPETKQALVNMCLVAKQMRENI